MLEQLLQRNLDPAAGIWVTLNLTAHKHFMQASPAAAGPAAAPAAGPVAAFLLAMALLLPLLLGLLLGLQASPASARLCL